MFMCLAGKRKCVFIVCVYMGRHQVSFLIANNFLIVKILVFSSVDVCLCQPYILPMLCHLTLEVLASTFLPLNITEQVIHFPQASLTRIHCLLKNALHPTIVEVF